MEYYKTMPEEQETYIWIDYFERKLHIYSNRKSVIERLTKKLGEPDKKDLLKILSCTKLASASWSINFSDKERIRIALSKTLLIGQMK